MRERMILAAVLACLSACSSQESQENTLPPNLQTQLDGLVRRVQYSQGLARLSDLRTLSAFGSHATPAVIEELLGSSNPQMRSSAVFVLGEIHRLEGDPQALTAIRSSLDDRDRTVRLEAARALLETGDVAGIPMLIDALDDPSRGTRMRAYLTLREATGGRDLGYHPDAEPELRREAIRRYRAHFDQVAGEPLVRD